ncbi:juvenile hormone esterase-like [Apis laboriosa]|uniref:juvenile hormone esterase-like n=1 Tax=Apis laboriosa TaxID=183418 RepID=UPI001CC3F6B1|nr:juvenile hormone esterase-like [Apis laboriosa]
MSQPIVTVKQGKLKGGIVKNVLGGKYIAFRGIPYAVPPIGKLRFKDPIPIGPWTDVKDTTKPTQYYCPQKQIYPPYQIIGSEDCLYLNVYTNSLDQSKPVMFYVHEGAFIFGSSSFQDVRPDYLLPKDVVVVSTNYRVGAFGFLNLGHRVAAGNYGLKDLILALEWVKENISNFGGDPNNVTIFGVSAGSVLVHALLLSPRAKGLFHKAIAQSGMLSSAWSKNQSQPDRGFKLAATLGKVSDDPEEVVEFLRKVAAEDIVKAQPTILTLEEKFSYAIPFGINCDEMAENPVMPEPIDQLLTNPIANVPVIISYTAHEYIMFLRGRGQNILNVLNEYLPTYVNSLRVLKKLDDEQIEELYEILTNQYFDGKPINDKKLRKVIDLLTLIYFELPAIMTIEDRAKRSLSSTYLCKFSFVGNEISLSDLVVKRQVSGASHTDDAPYLIYSPRLKSDNPDPPAVGTKDRITMERMTRMWTNFAKTGNPTSIKDEFVNVDWKPVTTNDLSYLDIGSKLEILPVLPHILRDEILSTNKNRIVKEKRRIMPSIFFNKEEGNRRWLW